MIANKELTQIENARQWLKLNRGRWVDITEAVTATGVERAAVSDAIRTMRIDGYNISQEGSKRNRRYFVDNKPPSKHRISRTVGKNMVMGYIERGEWFSLEGAQKATGATAHRILYAIGMLRRAGSVIQEQEGLYRFVGTTTVGLKVVKVAPLALDDILCLFVQNVETAWSSAHTAIVHHGFRLLQPVQTRDLTLYMLATMISQERWDLIDLLVAVKGVLIEYCTGVDTVHEIIKAGFKLCTLDEINIMLGGLYVEIAN